MKAARPRHGRASPGFTLVELMVVVVILAIFAALAGPSFTQLIASQRERAAASALYDSLMLARSEAIKRNATASLNSADLGSGWTVTLGGNTLRTQEAFSGLTFNPAAPGLSYNFDGRLSPGTGSTTVIISSAQTSTCWQVKVDVSGRATVGQGCS